jgi:quercetin dioxygenase-like cupin family protein
MSIKNLFIGFVLFVSLSGNVPDRQLVSVQQLCKSSSSWDGSPLPTYEKGQPEITIQRITIPPQVQLPLHKHPVINAGVLLKGKLTVVTRTNDKLYLDAGDPIIEVVNQWHYGKNEGDEPAEIIVFYASTVGKVITVKQERF